MNILIQEHEHFRSLSASLRALVSGQGPCDAAELARLRVQINRAMADHLANE